MSRIFRTETKTTVRPRADATIRVEIFKPGTTEKAGYIQAELLEFHPDYDNRAKFRSVAYIRATPELRELARERPHLYRLCGAGFLDEPYIEVREFTIHGEDVREMKAWCWDRHKPLILHPCPLPFPMFKKGDRVVVLAYKDDYHDSGEAAGQRGTITEDSSIGGMSSVRLDEEKHRQGFKSRGFPSIALRKIEGE